MKRFLFIVTVLWSCVTAAVVYPQTGAPVKNEIVTQFLRSNDKLTASRWANANISTDKGILPFSFTYDGKLSKDFLKNWQNNKITIKNNDGSIKNTITLKDLSTGLSVRCETLVYKDFPTVEWTIYFKNDGKTDTPVIEKIKALDVKLTKKSTDKFILHHFTGSPCSPTDYRPFEENMAPGESKHITTSGGRPTNSDMPYFNIETGDGGVIAVIGWPGQWAADFTRGGVNNLNDLNITAGQELTHFILHPGEEVRGPRVVMEFYSGDWIQGQNIWRRWMIAHNMPRPGGKVPDFECAACSSHQYGEMINADTASQEMFIDRYLERGIKLDYWWMDAGWYLQEKGWPQTGTWEIDTKRFPGGLRPICEHAHSKGVKTIVWFEPERVGADTWISNFHRDWMYGGKSEGLLNISRPDTWNWLVNHVDSLLVTQKIDLYRQDFNIDPLEYWRANDTADRQGISEIKHITAYLAYWDELIKRHPDLLIDTCASGGRRNDIETLRRAVPLLRSDWLLEPSSQQNHTYGVALWIPFYGTGINQFDSYSFRSCMCPHLTLCYDMRRNDQDYTPVRKLYKQWREQVAPCYMGDYYPLTTYSPDSTACMAFQFNLPEKEKGVVLAFRRPYSDNDRIVLKLRGLENNSVYTVQNLDTEKTVQMSGKDLAIKGLDVAFTEKPGSAVFTYRK